jgi:hypothetical protein
MVRRWRADSRLSWPRDAEQAQAGHEQNRAMFERMECQSVDNCRGQELEKMAAGKLAWPSALTACETMTWCRLFPSPRAMVLSGY